MKTWLRRPLLAGALLLALAACNGGGTDSGTADHQTSVPAPTDTTLLAEFTRINAVRSGLGLGLVAQSPNWMRPPRTIWTI